VQRLSAGDLQLLTSKDEFSRLSFNGRERKCLFVNGHGRRFIEAGYPLGLDADVEGRGAAIADLDQDGRLDILLRAVARKKLSYFHNDLAAAGHFLRVELEGTRSNRDAVGSIVRVRAAAQTQMRIKTAGAGFQSQSEGTLHFGLGSASQADSLRVEWPSGQVEEFPEVPADRIVRIVEGRGITQMRRSPGISGAAQRTLDRTLKWTAWNVNGGSWNPPLRQPLLLTFWASWCAACRAEIPALNSMYQKLGGKVAVAGVGIGEDATGVQVYESNVKPAYPILISYEQSMAGLLEKVFPDGEIALPAAVLFDASGSPRRVFRGAIREDAIEREIETLLQRPSQ
jgi:thiol-disulfide isomerase/thioredoxin